MATNDKYDRQLRLWGANGQRALMEAHILLIQADAVGTETLKNLVLPGVGSFTILDDFIVDHQDLGCNFFVEEQSMGKPRAEIVTDLLCEMNSDVNGHARVANFQNVFQTEPDYFKNFSLIITANLPEYQLLPLASLCWSQGINLIVVKSYGLIGSVRLQLNQHNIIESRSEADSFDLRISCPFSGLVEYCESLHLDEMDSLQHAHVPYPVILYRAIHDWRAAHDGKIPKNFSEKEEFKTQIKKMARDYHMEVNFQEAVRESYRAYACRDIGCELQELLSNCDASISSNGDKYVKPLPDSCTSFDVLVRALALFVAEKKLAISSSSSSSATTSLSANLLPLSGTIPDLTSTTENYVMLQQVYQAQAKQDLAAFQVLVNHVLQQSENAKSLDGLVVSAESVEEFCKNAQSILQVTTSPLSAEFASIDHDNDMIAEALTEDQFDQDPVQTPLLWYLALRAADRFHAKYARWPGSSQQQMTPLDTISGGSLGAGAGVGSTLESDQEEVFLELRRLCEEEYRLSEALLEPPTLLVSPPPPASPGAAAMQLEDAEEEEEEKEEEGLDSSILVRRAHAVEITRYGGRELHNISALVGGIAAQEAVKVVARQFIPLNNTYIFNGIACCGATYTL